MSSVKWWAVDPGGDELKTIYLDTPGTYKGDELKTIYLDTSGT